LDNKVSDNIIDARCSHEVDKDCCFIHLYRDVFSWNVGTFTPG